MIVKLHPYRQGLGEDVAFLKGTGSVHVDRITEIRGERNGQPFIWRKEA